MSITRRSLLGGLTVVASIGTMLLPSQAGEQPDFDFGRNTPHVRVARQVSNVNWGDWQKMSNAYEGRFGEVRSVGGVTFAGLPIRGLAPIDTIRRAPNGAPDCVAVKNSIELQNAIEAIRIQ